MKVNNVTARWGERSPQVYMTRQTCHSHSSNDESRPTGDWSAVLSLVSSAHGARLMRLTTKKPRWAFLKSSCGARSSHSLAVAGPVSLRLTWAKKKQEIKKTSVAFCRCRCHVVNGMMTIFTVLSRHQLRSRPH